MSPPFRPDLDQGEPRRLQFGLERFERFFTGLFNDSITALWSSWYSSYSNSWSRECSSPSISRAIASRNSVPARRET